MILNDGVFITSPSDLTAAAACEFGFARRLDAALGRVAMVASADDPMLNRAARLGDDHERAVLDSYRRSGLSVVEIARPRIRDEDEFSAALAATGDALESGADVVFQAAFFDGEMVGFADFIVRCPDGRYEVQDTKLARTAKVTALLQLAAYADQMRKIGIEPADQTTLILGDGRRSVHALRDIEPVYRARAARLRLLVDDRLADTEMVEWGSPGITACGSCEWCAPEVEQSDDVLQVAGLRQSQRLALREVGVETVTDLAQRTDPVPGVGSGTLRALSLQARLQIEARREGRLPVAIQDLYAIAELPEPDEGDIFFDFEGDPMYAEAGSEQDEVAWGLDYLFGLVDRSRQFTAFWAHDLAQERAALVAFLAYVRAKRAERPGMHIYHYAAYERTHLLSIAARHGECEAEVDQLLREGVLIDLYPVVRRFMRVGANSYSLKKIEELYLSAEDRANDVETAVGSVEAYWHYRELVDLGRDEEADEVLSTIARYNEVDCVSTLKLHQWLIDEAAKRGVRPTNVSPLGDGDDPLAPTYEEPELAMQLRQIAGDPTDANRTAEQEAAGIAGAAVDYFRREAKSYWQAHFQRLRDPLEDWSDVRDVMVVDPDNSIVEEDWSPPVGKSRSWTRTLKLRGEFGPGTTLRAGTSPFLVYGFEALDEVQRPGPGMRPAHPRATIIEIDVDEGWVVVEERHGKDEADYDPLPIAITPPAPIRPGEMPVAIQEWGTAVLAAQPQWPQDPVSDLLLRAAPRMVGGVLHAMGEPADADHITESVLRLDSSYLAVQGPPGTGKTYTGAQVVANLVQRRGWKIGVVAQSHAAVENLLRAVNAAGVPKDRIGKKANRNANGDEDVPWTVLTPAAIAGFLADRGGRVVGGTSWDFAKATSVPRRSLDLLVIDEAGQFSIASTIASTVSARNLLMLGDPQQLPQVSQGAHAEPVNTSALGYLSDGNDVLPPEFGYFLDTTWRMSPALTATVSDLSYSGRLRAAPAAGVRSLSAQGTARSLIPLTSGLHAVPVMHVGRATESIEEAETIAALISSLIGATWRDPHKGEERALGQSDFIVVTPYNAQVARIADTLAARGLDEVQVGTVDKFQGREAVISVISMAASTPADVPRGMSFLLMRNRLNVAISRAQWASYLVYSPALTDYLPHSPDAVAELSAFLRLVEQ